MYHSSGGYTDNRGGNVMCKGMGNLCAFLLICYEPKTALKNSLQKKKNNECSISTNITIHTRRDLYIEKFYT